MKPVVGLVAMWFAVVPYLCGANAESPSKPALQLVPANFQSIAGRTIRSSSAVEHFYRERDMKAAWTGGTESALQELRMAVRDAETHGLSPDDYHAEALSKAIRDGNDQAVELLATDAYLTLGLHLLRGKIDPVSIEPSWTAVRRSVDLTRHLSEALQGDGVKDSLEALTPNVRSYRILRAALKKYNAAAAAGDWPTVSDGPTLKLGMDGPRVRALRQRLEIEGLLEKASVSQNEILDATTEAAIAAFQRQAGLDADGKAGPATLRELNRSATDRAAQIRANLERWRWLPLDLGPRHIRVNIAAFQLEAWTDGRMAHRHDVIVGRTYRETPVFASEMSYVVFNPWWEIPQRIARLDKLPAFKSDPASIARLGYDVLDLGGRMLDPSTIDWQLYSARNFPFRLRQRPGPQNALGEVKLIFPNRHDVYLHGTPTRELFDRARRDFSSGCIRVHRVLDFTAWALSQTPGWHRRKIDEIVASGRETRVNLRVKIPVHILYMTAVATPEGSIRFLSDLYDRDARLIAALDRPPR